MAIMNEIVKYSDTVLVDEISGAGNRRSSKERRTRLIRSFFCSVYKGRRRISQRIVDRQNPYYIDVYDVKLLLVIMLIILLCIADTYFTLIILSNGGVELNPFMNTLLAISPKAFFVGKYLITSIGLCLAVLHVNFTLFRLFPVRNILNTLSCLYICLIVYEVNLIFMWG